MEGPVKLEALLASGQDNALLRFALGSEYLKVGIPDDAIRHLAIAVTLNPDYSAAWKLLGKAQSEAGLASLAIETYRKGIDVASRAGDKQAVREMQVFLRRLENPQ